MLLGDVLWFPWYPAAPAVQSLFWDVGQNITVCISIFHIHPADNFLSQ